MHLGAVGEDPAQALDERGLDRRARDEDAAQALRQAHAARERPRDDAAPDRGRAERARRAALARGAHDLGRIAATRAAGVHPRERAGHPERGREEREVREAGEIDLAFVEAVERAERLDLRCEVRVRVDDALRGARAPRREEDRGLGVGGAIDGAERAARGLRDRVEGRQTREPALPGGDRDLDRSELAAVERVEDVRRRSADQRARVRAAEATGERARPHARVGDDRDRSQSEEGEERGDEFAARRDEERGAVAGREAELQQPVRDRVGPRVELRVRRPRRRPRELDDGDRGRRSSRALGEVLRDFGGGRGRDELGHESRIGLRRARRSS